MNPQQRDMIRKAVEAFPTKEMATKEALTEFYNRNGVAEEDRVYEGFEDFIYQVENDNKMVVLYKDVLKALQELEYIPEFEGEAERNALFKKNQMVSTEIVKLFENAGLPFLLVNKVANELGGMTGRTIESAGDTAFGRSMDVLKHIAEKHFGGEFNLSHVRDYIAEIYEKHHKTV